MYPCSMCPYFSTRRDNLIRHLLYRHRNAPNFIVHCSSSGCGTSFKSYNAFRMHCNRKHLLNEEDDDHNVIEQDGDLEERMETEAEIENEQEQQVADAQFLLKLRAGLNISQSGLSEIILSVRQLLSQKMLVVKERLREHLPPDMHDVLEANDISDIFQQNVFDGLDTEYLQDKYFKEHMGLINPVMVKLGTINKLVKVRGQYRYMQREVLGYYVPFFKQLETLLAMPEVQECLHEEVTHNGLMTDFYDGSHMSKDFFQNHPDSLLFGLYFDDFEIANPIGAHRKKHKLSIFYWSLLNISPEFRFKLQATQLLAVAKTGSLKKFGMSAMLSDFVQSMKTLHAGCEIKIGKDVKKMYGSLLCVLGDTLGAQLLGGFKEGVGLAEKPCRSCEITHRDLGKSLHGQQFSQRDEQEHRDRCDHLEELNKGARKYWSRKYGITSRSVLLDIPIFDVTKCILHDPMHVILEGVAKLEIQLMLGDFITKKHYFSLKMLNSAIKNFNYSTEESQDKPQELEMKSLDCKNVLPMTAIEIKNFLILLPFLIGDKVPEDDLMWMNFVRLLKITLLVISPVASEDTIDTLHQLIYEHNHSFSVIYPDTDFRPKLHYLAHFPHQIQAFGPGRNHWCARLEAKHSLIKNKKWKNFRAIHKSVAFYHQKWMCLQQNMQNCRGSEVYLYPGDTVGNGIPVSKEVLKEEVRCYIEGYDEMIPPIVMSTNYVNIHAVPYRTGSVLLLEYQELDQPLFAMIEEIYVINSAKYFLCLHLEIKYFSSHMNAFECKKSHLRSTVRIQNLKYKWPQNTHFVDGKMFVMPVNVDFAWS